SARVGSETSPSEAGVGLISMKATAGGDPRSTVAGACMRNSLSAESRRDGSAEVAASTSAAARPLSGACQNRCASTSWSSATATSTPSSAPARTPHSTLGPGARWRTSIAQRSRSLRQAPSVISADSPGESPQPYRSGTSTAQPRAANRHAWAAITRRAQRRSSPSGCTHRTVPRGSLSTGIHHTPKRAPFSKPSRRAGSKRAGPSRPSTRAASRVLLTEIQGSIARPFYRRCFRPGAVPSTVPSAEKSNIMQLRKAVFPVAGLGTRFLPATKSIPKEMLPIVDRPIIQYAVDEAIEAGCDTLIFVTGRSKRAVEDYFDRNPELESELEAKGKVEALELVRDIVPPHVKVLFVRQPAPLGLGHAVLCAAPMIGEDEHFAVLLPDDLIDGHPEGVLSQMLPFAESSGGSVVAIEQVPRADVSKYGIVSPADEQGPRMRITS